MADIGLENLTNDEFIEYCYKYILHRPSDADGKRFYLSALNSHRINRGQVLLGFVTSEENQKLESASEFFPPGHFHSALPSAEDRVHHFENKNDVKSLPGIELHEDRQLGLLEQLKEFYHECPFPETKSELYRYYFENSYYSYTDAIILYGLMRLFKPGRIIEIGSGFSSSVMMDTNDQFFDGSIELTFIEPYPERLESLMNENDVNKYEVVAENLQKVDLKRFEQLGENDVLFIDSTHVSKLQSDVNRIIFDILPRLAQGVLIHIHDIFWPFEYPDDWIRKRRVWNEAYVLRAFLEFNDSFEIILFAHYLHAYHGKWFQENMPHCMKNRGGNIWLRKIR